MTKKNETKKSDTNRDSIPLDKGKSSSEAGKGDRLRRGISQNEWEEKWKKIFREKKCI